jgi:hypothetical protein
MAAGSNDHENTHFEVCRWILSCDHEGKDAETFQGL